jgi:aminocarboxymuconate-semialdehyde decarboxylase
MTDAIDVHGHAVPVPLLERLRGGEFGVTVTESGDTWQFHMSPEFESRPFGSEMTDVDARIARMDAAGIGRQLVSSFVDVGAERALPEHAAAYATALNDALAETIAAKPDRLLGLATVPLHDPPAAAAELDRAANGLGFVGAEIGCPDLGDRALDPFWQAAQRNRSIVLVHPGAARTSPLPYFLGNFVGNPAETTEAGASLILGGALARFPGLRVILVHGGGFLPYQIGRIAHGHRRYGDRFGASLPASASPLDELRGLYYDTILHDPTALAYLVARVGADRIVVGTDYPFPMGDDDPQATVAGIPGLGDTERGLILSGTADRLIAEALSLPDHGPR